MLEVIRHTLLIPSKISLYSSQNRHFKCYSSLFLNNVLSCFQNITSSFIQHFMLQHIYFSEQLLIHYTINQAEHWPSTQIHYLLAHRDSFWFAKLHKAVSLIRIMFMPKLYVFLQYLNEKQWYFTSKLNTAFSDLQLTKTQSQTRKYF